jgi:hypothetical protein
MSPACTNSADRPPAAHVGFGYLTQEKAQVSLSSFPKYSIALTVQIAPI